MGVDSKQKENSGTGEKTYASGIGQSRLLTQDGSHAMSFQWWLVSVFSMYDGLYDGVSVLCRAAYCVKIFVIMFSNAVLTVESWLVTVSGQYLGNNDFQAPVLENWLSRLKSRQFVQQIVRSFLSRELYLFLFALATYAYLHGSK